MHIVEEQFRLTLHFHHLIWLHGHQQTESQLKAAQKFSSTTLPSNFEVPSPGKEQSTVEKNNNSHKMIRFLPGLNEFEAILERLKKNIKTFTVGELHLLSKKAESITSCLNA